MARKKLQKAFALLLSVSMTMSLLSVGALAADEMEEHAHEAITCPACEGEQYQRETCEACGGAGEITGEPTECTECEGKGSYETWDFEHPCPVCNEKGCTDNPNCMFGYELYEKTCDACGGSGEVIETSTCEACGGEGSILTEIPCETCQADGTVPCTGTDFDQSALTHVAYGEDKAITGGTMTHTCSVCGASYEEVLEAEAACDLMTQALSVEEFEVDAQIANAGQGLTYSLELSNHNEFDFPNIQVQVEIPEGLTLTPYNNHTDVYISGSYKGSGVKPAYSAASAEYDEEARVLTLTIPGICAGKTFEAKFRALVDEDVALGVDLTAALTATAGGEEAPELSGSASTHINKYTGTRNIYLAGAKMAGWYNPGDQVAKRTATETTGNSNTSLDALEGAVFSFEEAFNKDRNPTTGYVWYDTTDAKYYGESLKNSSDGRIWQCVGFVPYPGLNGNSDYETVAAHVYTDAENEEGFTMGSLEDAVQFVEDQKGVLYGETAAEENIRALEEKIYQNVLTIMTVWYAAEPEPLEMGDYGELTIDPVSPLDSAPTSRDVTLALGEVEQSQKNGDVFFDAELTVTIGAGAPSEINVNLEEILAQAISKIAAMHYNQVQPGDTLRFHIQVVNNSGRDYHYVADSVQISTVDLFQEEGGEVLGTGFDGFRIASRTIPNRQLNQMLQELGAEDTDDETVGAALREAGYGDETMADAEITQQYLGHYYLDYLNRYRPADGKAGDFQDLEIEELAQLTGAHDGGDPETCQDVAEALYYFYYGQVFRFSDTALYDHMKDNSSLDRSFSDAMDSGEPYVLLFSTLAGEEMNNAFMNTHIGFGMQFRMAVTDDGGDGGRDDDDDDDDDPTDIPDEETPTTDLPDEETPTTDLPEEEVPTTELPEEEVPMAEVPETGDAAALWLALSALSGTGLAGVTFLGRGKREDA